MASSHLFQVRFADDRLQKLIKDLGAMPAEVRKAVPRALNRTAVTVRSDTVKEISGHVNLKTSSIREVINIDRATQSRPVAHVVLEDSPRPLFDYKGVRVTKRKGVSVQLYVGGARQTFKHAFRARVNVLPTIGRTSGHAGIFERRRIGNPDGSLALGSSRPSRAGRMWDRKRERRATAAGFSQRLPIKELRGPGVVKTYSKAPEVANRIIAGAADTLAKNFQHEIAYLVHKRNRPVENRSMQAD